MKRYLHFYVWLAAVMIMICGTSTVSAQTKVASLSRLKVGSVIKIYPRSSDGTSHYGESSLALACSGNQNSLTSYEKAGSGDSWTIVDAGDGYYYLMNDKGCYWAYQSKSSYSSLTCTTSQSSAVKVSLTWDFRYGGVCFWNKQDGTGLNNLNGYNYRYNWWSSKSDYASDANTTFDVAIIQEGSGESVDDKIKDVVIDGLKYLLNLRDKTAQVIPNDYTGSHLTIPQKVSYEGTDCTVTSLGEKCFERCANLTNITLPESIASIGEDCFLGSGLASITLPRNITFMGTYCFAFCGSLKSVVVSEGITSLSNGCFAWCDNLKEIALPSTLQTIGYNALSEENLQISCSAALPPKCDNKNISSSCMLYVPKESLEQYKSTSPWKDASLINPLYPTTSISMAAETSVVKTKPTQVEYTILPENVGNKTLTWNSENPSVVSVDDKGVVTGKKVGTAKITATTVDGTDITASTVVSVLPLSVSDFTANTVSVDKAIPTQMVMSITPGDADNPKLKWTSLTPEIATVTEDGVVTGLKLGIAKLQAETTDGSNISKTFDVEVTITHVSNIYFPSTTISVTKTKTGKIPVTVVPAIAENPKLTWTSSNTDIATIDENGVVTGKKVGTVRITATATDGSNVTASKDVAIAPLKVESMTFAEPEVSIIKTNQRTIKLTLNSEEVDNKTMIWTSSDKSVATVAKNSNATYPLEAIVTAKKVGKAVIKAEAQDGSGMSATCEVEVTPLMATDFTAKTTNVVKNVPTKMQLTFTPTDADNQALKWTSLNSEVASVTEDGMVTGLKIGTTQLKAETTEGPKITKTFDVKVDGIEFSQSKVSVDKTGSTWNWLTDNSARLGGYLCSSADESVATVERPSFYFPASFRIYGHKVGKTTIKVVADGGYVATCEVEVTPLMVRFISALTTSVVKTIPTKMDVVVTPKEADNQKLKWSSLTPDVATITEDGMVTGIKMGTAQLQAESTDGSNISSTFDVQVAGLPVSTISLPKEASIIKTDKQKLEYSILPLASDNQILKWSSSAPTIASVDETTGVITANKVGDAVITATATDGSGISASTTIHVTPLKISNIGITKELSLLRTMTGQIETTIEPEFADNKTLKWTSDDENIATVTQEGVVKAVNVGSANITATTTDGSNVSAICKVTVTPVTINLSTKTINLRKGDSYAEQMVNVLPENYEHRDVTWSSSDESVASVNADGVITAVKPGITTIKYVLDYDNNITADCKVIVYDENVVYVGGIYYILDKESKEATVTSIYGGTNTSLDATKVAQYYSGTINIPETIIYDGDKYTVKKVGSYAFNCQNELQSIIVPRTVTMIQDNAAIHAENLNRVNVANESQLVSIGKRAFMECTGLKRFNFDGTSLLMDIIDKEAFKNCTALERVTWTDDTSIKTIGYGVFYGCSALEKVQWMKKSELKTIQDYAFFKCVSLNNFEMPNTTLSVGNSSFRYNSGLTNIHLSTSLNYIDEYAFGECGFSQITLPESLANIQAGAFINNEHLQEITLPEKLQGLGSAAFENNSALESVTFKTAIETMTIGNNAFNQCPILNKVYITNLNSFAQTNFNNAKANPANTSQHIYDANGKEIINVVLPKGTKYVNNNAFNGCAYIKSIEMPATMDHINDDIFYGCSALKDVYCYAEDVPDFIGVNDPSSMDAVFKQATLHVPFGSEAKYQKDTEWWGRFGNIQGCDPQPTQVVTQIDLSTRTVNLKAGTTYNEQKITVTPAEAANVRIKYSTADRNVADIDEDGVIHGVAAGVTTITYTANDGSGVTAECKVIVREPEVEYVGDLYYLFDKGKKQATVTSIYGGKNTSLDAEKVAQYYTGTVNIPEQTTFDAVTYDVKAIGGYAFTCQNDLQALRVGAFVEEIADNAATKAINLNRITVANASQLKNIGKEAFMDCVGLQHVLFEGTTQNMEAINEAAFKNCTALQDVIWEGKSTLNLIGNSAFYGCSKLETVKWNDLCTLQVIDDYAFYQCSSLNHFIMPNSTLSVGKYSFRYDAALTDISLSTSLSIIYDYAFGECGFTQIVLPESLKSLQAGAFINNSYLADIIIPKKLEGIGAGAFENNDALETVTFKTHETKLTVDKNAFNYCPVLSKVNIDYLDDWAHINFQNAAANPASTAHRLYLNNVEIIDVNLPSGTKYIGNNVFNGCSNIRTLTVPATVEHINDNIIYGCSALRDVYCYAAKVPQFIGTEDASAMSDVFNQATLHVIYGNEAAYKADSWWGRFYKVEGCNAPSDTDVKVSSITISQTEATLKPDDTMQLEATVYPTNAANKKINWSSSNEDVAQVTEDGFVLAITEGEADITAEAADGSGIKAVCHITVENEKKPVVPIVEIKFEQSPVTIALGESFKLNVIFNPANASNKELTWTTSRSAVATVDREGNVYGVTEGKAIITAKTTDGSNLTINCVVTVSKTTGIGNITIGDVKMILDKRHLKVEGLADNDIVQIVNTIGFTVYKGTEHEMDLDAPGIYIIKVKGKTLKFSVK